MESTDAIFIRKEGTVESMQRFYRRFLWSKVFLIWRTPCSKSKQIEYPNYMGRYSITLVYNLYYANSFMHMVNVM